MDLLGVAGPEAHPAHSVSEAPGPLWGATDPLAGRLYGPPTTTQLDAVAVEGNPFMEQKLALA